MRAKRSVRPARREVGRAAGLRSEESQQGATAPPSGSDRSGDPFLDSITATAGPAAYYKEHRVSGLYKKDARQEGTILKLQELYEILRQSLKGKRRGSGLTVVDHSGTTQGHHSWWQGISTFLGDKHVDSETPIAKIKGLYMYGGVGTGKTMLMDLLVHAAPPQFKLRRLHFHDFMLETHARLREFARQADPLVHVADASAAGTRVLCLDELFVTDVADAAILNRLFGRMWDRGVVLVATSNRRPDDLYKGGLQRELFLPFIERLKAETEVHDMASPVDYRKLAHHSRGTYLTPESSADADGELTQHFTELVTAAGGKAPRPERVKVQMGRTLDVPLAGARMALMTFSELCRNNLGAADYIALAGAVHSLSLRGVPVFDSSTRPEAYRFVTLVDVLYENRIRLFCSAAAQPVDIFANVLSQQEAKSAERAGERSDALIVDDNLAFSKDRTVSRLLEMGSSEYLLSHARRHVPCLVLALEEPGRHPAAEREQLAAAA